MLILFSVFVWRSNGRDLTHFDHTGWDCTLLKASHLSKQEHEGFYRNLQIVGEVEILENYTFIFISFLLHHACFLPSICLLYLGYPKLIYFKYILLIFEGATSVSAELNVYFHLYYLFLLETGSSNLMPKHPGKTDL